MKVVRAWNPVRTAWGVDLMVEFDTLGVVPYHSTPDYVPGGYEEELYVSAMRGDYGEIAPAIVPVLTAEEVYQAARKDRADRVASIVVEVDGMCFDGDETSQDRMARTVVAMGAAGVGVMPWKLANDSVAEVTKEQLAAALVKAGQEQARLWFI